MYGLQHKRPMNMKEQGERELNKGEKQFSKGAWHYDECYIAVLVHYLHYCILVLFSKPEEKQVLGLHQPMGSPIGSGDAYDCSKEQLLTYPYPFTPAAFPPFLKSDLYNVSVWRRPYLCESGVLFEEGYFNFRECSKADEQEVNVLSLMYMVFRLL